MGRGIGQLFGANLNKNTGIKKKKKKDNIAKNPAGTTVESQKEYFSNPENVKKAQDAVASFLGKSKSDGAKEPTVRRSVASDGGGNSLDKKIINTEKSGPYVIDPEEIKRQKGIGERKNPKLEKLRSELGMKDASSSDSSKYSTPDLVALGKENKAKGMTRSDLRRKQRDERVATRRAGKTAKKLFKEGIGTDQTQMDANIQAEKDKIQKRRANRKEYLRNFASQLTRGVQADPKSFETKSDIGYFKGQKESQASDNNKETKPSAAQIAKESEVESYENNFRNQLGMTSDFNNSKFDKYLGIGHNESNPFTQSFDKDRDSMGNNFTSEYLKKMGKL
tara:strand:- start:75 stop:1082 length:1008 start_codon:yes stop_codon:yes gene_type:complete